MKYNVLEFPSEPFFDYDRPITETNKPIPCKKCGKNHGNGILDTKNYTHTYIDLCKKCFYKDAYIYKPISEQVVLSETEKA